MHDVYHCRDFPGRYLVDVPRATLPDFLHRNVFVPYDKNTVIGIEGYWKSVQHPVTMHVHTCEDRRPKVRVFSPRVSDMVHKTLLDAARPWAALESIVMEQLALDGDEVYAFSLTHTGTKNAVVIPNPRCVRHQLCMFDYETVDPHHPMYNQPMKHDHPLIKLPLQPIKHRVLQCRAFPDHYMMNVPRSEIPHFLDRHVPFKENEVVLGIGGYWKMFQRHIAMFVHFPNVTVRVFPPDRDATIDKALDCYNDRWEALKKMIVDQLGMEQDTYMLSIACNGKEIFIPSQRFVEKQLQVYNYKHVDCENLSEIFIQD